VKIFVECAASFTLLLNAQSHCYQTASGGGHGTKKRRGTRWMEMPQYARRHKLLDASCFISLLRGEICLFFFHIIYNSDTQKSSGNLFIFGIEFGIDKTRHLKKCCWEIEKSKLFRTWYIMNNKCSQALINVWRTEHFYSCNPFVSRHSFSRLG